jgi:hypothetical protein
MARRYTDQESKTKKIVISIFFAVIMVSSMLAIMFSGYTQNTSVEYNGHTFKQQGNYLVTKLGKTTIKIQSYPANLASIAVDDAVVQKLSSGYPVYLSTPLTSQYKEYAGQAAYDLGDYLATIGVQSGIVISDNNTGYSNIPLITCANATSSKPVVLFEETNQSSITLEGDCIKIGGTTSNDFIALKDRLVLKLSGIMP